MGSEHLILILFIVAYLFFIIFPKKRTIAAVSCSLLAIILARVPLSTAFSSVDWNVMGIFVGTLVVADIFMLSRAPAFLAERLVLHVQDARWAILLICALTGFISAFVENVATVLLIVPVALTLSERLDIDPVPLLIAIAISSNLQGTATLIGDPPSMLLASFARMNFNDFFVLQGKPGIFFAVEIGALSAFLVLFVLFRKEKRKITINPHERVTSWTPTWILITLIVLLALSSSFDHELSAYLPGVICMLCGGISLIWIFSRKLSPLDSIRRLDWDTTFFIISVFILVGILVREGWMTVLAEWIHHQAGSNKLGIFLIIITVAMLFSAFVDNIPFIITMMPVVQSISSKGGFPLHLLLFGLLIGSCLGGNITPIGASANIVATGILQKRGEDVSFCRFVRIGLPFTLAAVIPAAVFIWIFWA
ncbi:MAG: SLC13 family permease [bacterium]